MGNFVFGFAVSVEMAYAITFCAVLIAMVTIKKVVDWVKRRVFK